MHSMQINEKQVFARKMTKNCFYVGAQKRWKRFHLCFKSLFWRKICIAIFPLCTFGINSSPRQKCARLVIFISECLCKVSSHLHSSLSFLYTAPNLNLHNTGYTTIEKHWPKRTLKKRRIKLNFVPLNGVFTVLLRSTDWPLNPFRGNLRIFALD